MGNIKFISDACFSLIENTLVPDKQVFHHSVQFYVEAFKCFPARYEDSVIRLSGHAVVQAKKTYLSFKAVMALRLIQQSVVNR